MGVADMTRMCGCAPFFAERAALLHAEAVLLVRDGKTEIVKAHVLREQGVRADGDIAHALLQRGFDRAFFLLPSSSRSEGIRGCRTARESPAKVFTCCCAKISVGAMKALWYPARCAAHKKRRRDKRFAAADIALQKARHPLAGRHIAQCLVRGAPLRSRRRKRGERHKTL